MPSQAKQKRVQQAPCRNCNLLTPAWRELCVHCGNPLADAGAEEYGKKELAEALNDDLASEDVLYHQYKKHHSAVDGPMRLALRSLFEELASEVFRNAGLLGERLTLSGGVRISARSLRYEAASIEPEGAAGAQSSRAMLQSDLSAEQCMIVALSRHIVLACELGDNDTEETLKYIMSKHEGHVAKLAWLLHENNGHLGLRAAEPLHAPE